MVCENSSYYLDGSGWEVNRVPEFYKNQFKKL